MADVPAEAAARNRELHPDLRTQLLAQKTDLIGELAGAISNEFNNLMMAVTSYAELELKKAPPAERRSLEQVLSNSARAASLIQKLLAFSRTRVSSQDPLHLNCVVTETTELLRQLVGEQIEIVLSLEPQLQRIKADRAELEELMMLMAIHGRDAMAGCGKLSITTQSVDLDQATIGANEAVTPGKYVMLSVRDSGTSPAGPRRGSNPGAKGQDFRISLALAAINRVVQEARGLMRISSEPDEGTQFIMYFPALAGGARETEGAFAHKSSIASRTILVVEDDDAVRVPAVEFLKMEGFKVLQAKTGPEAINIAVHKRSPLDLLITDIVMPAMSGREVAKELLEMHPGLRVLYMSGDAGEAAVADSQSQDDVLQKPFRLDKLNEKIRTLLGE
ncbi:MAG: response regulator [Acidobacteriia bacterium]|nr:response regulator [Terriglobia bacterium]